MTRINCIPPHELTRQHLVAEYKEILRTRHLHPRRKMPSVPTYRMGRGHVLFFADKGRWLVNRHAALVAEMRHRDYTVNYPRLDLSHWPPEAMGDWEPDEAALAVSRGRIAERLEAA